MELKIRSGVHVLDALYHEASGKCGILLLHGFGSDKHENGMFDYLAEHFVSAGVHVLRIDLPGMGKTGGNLEDIYPDDFRQAVHDAFQYLLDRAPHSMILGSSFGNVCALFDLPKACKAFIAFFPPIYGLMPWEDVLEIACLSGWRGLLAKSRPLPTKMGLAIGPHFITLLKELDFIKMAQDAHVPFMLLHGSRDRFLPKEHAERFMDALPEPKEYHVFDGCGHDLRPVKEEVANLCISWIVRYCS